MTASGTRANIKVLFALTLVHFTGDFYSSFISPLFPLFCGPHGPEPGPRWGIIAGAARLLAFIVLERWHAWHGRRRTLIWSGGAMALGFAGVLLAPDKWWMVGALTVLGVGIGTTYAAALYYAMEAGDANVDAGGAHEAMIGVGYMSGPLAALVAVGAVDIGVIPKEQTNGWTLGVVGAVGIGIGFLIVRRARRPIYGA